MPPGRSGAMKRVIGSVVLGGTAILSLLYLSSPRADEVPHGPNGEFLVDSGGDVTYCLVCHDGTRVKPLDPSHPVDKTYPAAGQDASYVAYDQASSAGIRFINGQVACISCHNLKNPDRYHLTVEMARSRLCLTCHVK